MPRHIFRYVIATLPAMICRAAPSPPSLHDAMLLRRRRFARYIRAHAAPPFFLQDAVYCRLIHDSATIFRYEMLMLIFMPRLSLLLIRRCRY